MPAATGDRARLSSGSGRFGSPGGLPFEALSPKGAL